MAKKPQSKKRTRSRRQPARGRRAGVTWRTGPFVATAGARTASGERVTPSSAMGLSSYFAGARNISEDVAKLPKAVVERLLPRGRAVLDEHPVTGLFDDGFNPYCDAFTGVQTVTFWAVGWGNGCAEIEFNDAGDVVALWPIHPSRIRLDVSKGVPVYQVCVDDITGRTTPPQPYEPSEIFHLRGIGDQWQGWSPAQVHAETIGIGLAARGFAAAFFGNDTAIGNVVSLEGRIPKQEREAFRQDLQKNYAGARRSHGLLVLDSNAKIARMGLPPQDAQYIETQEWTVEDVARILRCPPHKLGHLKRASGWSTLEATNTDYVVDTLMPWAVRWEKEARRKLLVGQPRRRLVFFFQGMLRGDFKTRSDGYRSMVQGGVMTPNEVRELEDMNPSTSPGADELWMQGAMAPMRRLLSGPAPTAAAPGSSSSTDVVEPPADGAADTSVEDRVRGEALAERVGRKVAAAFARHASSHADDVEGFRSWARRFTSQLSDELARGAGPILGDRAAVWAQSRADAIGRMLVESFVDRRTVVAAAVEAELSESLMEVL
ncbi:MAG: phage portal protein [Planctomycetes bacterium]|nr:phage portal protein [Planctomycetota bacterium]